MVLPYSRDAMSQAEEAGQCELRAVETDSCIPRRLSGGNLVSHWGSGYGNGGAGV